ncbi:hypothetical protein WG66_013452 [Moniliophthora roreri]|nr:hypothetical protein WG66_013452 [Moniliophthora roreri]
MSSTPTFFDRKLLLLGYLTVKLHSLDRIFWELAFVFDEKAPQKPPIRISCLPRRHETSARGHKCHQ